MKLNRKKNRVIASARVFASNDIVKIENALNNMVGQPVKKAMDYLARFGFDNTELNGQDGYRKTSGLNQYDTWAGYEDESGNYVKIYYTMVRDRNRGGDAFVGGKLRGVYVDGYDVEASTRTRKRSIKASALRRRSNSKRSIKANRTRSAKRSIMAGAGSGITLEIEYFDITKVFDDKFYGDFGGVNGYHPFLKPQNGNCEGVLEIKSIHTYYYGGDPGVGEIPVNVKVTEVIPDTDEEAQAIFDAGLKEVLDNISELDDDKIGIGGGWLRSTFNGKFELIAYCYDYGATIKMEVEIPDEALVNWLDDFCHGDNVTLEYYVCINDDPQGNYYESQEDAIATAEKYASDPAYADDEITVRVNHYILNYAGDISSYYDDDGDVIWNSNDYLYE